MSLPSEITLAELVFTENRVLNCLRSNRVLPEEELVRDDEAGTPNCAYFALQVLNTVVSSALGRSSILNHA